MRREPTFALLAFLPALFAVGQQPAPPTLPAAPPPTAQTVYYADPGVTAPELLPVTVTDEAIGDCKHLDGIAFLSAVIDENGVPHDISLHASPGNGLDEEAVRLVTAERFKPGTYNGAPATIAITTWLEMKACIQEQKNDAGEKINLIRLRSAPEQGLELKPAPAGNAPSERGHPGVRTSAPVLLNRIEAKYSDYGLQQRINGACVISLIIDTHGMPQNVHIFKSLEPSLDQNALNAVSQYRFKPAMRNGTPVPVMITVEVDFRLFQH
jgi:TonB family protein